ncbi:hypothetical protein MWU59_10115 [Flavobacteriaceae bacterium F08102]|nr:hypothetical protein [Flavobacteriaceae bacterium F08102]
MEKEKVIAVLRSQPFWQPLLTISVLAFVAYLLLLAVYTPIFTETVTPTRSFLISFEFILFMSSIGLALLIRKKTFLDLKNNRYKVEFSIGWIKRGEWKDLPVLDYVSVFSNEPEHFDVNLWYDYNKHITMFVLTDKNHAFDIACRIALEQNIRLLDATVRHKKHYVNLEELCKKYGYEPAPKAS